MARSTAVGEFSASINIFKYIQLMCLLNATSELNVSNEIKDNENHEANIIPQYSLPFDIHFLGL